LARGFELIEWSAEPERIGPTVTFRFKSNLPQAKSLCKAKDGAHESVAVLVESRHETSINPKPFVVAALPRVDGVLPSARCKGYRLYCIAKREDAPSDIRSSQRRTTP
jgi:hypothetical protein